MQQGYTYDVVSGTMLPDPPRAQPTAGNWRTSEHQKHYGKPIKGTQAGPVWSANMHGVGTELRSKRRPTRAETRARVQAGTLPESAMPARGGRNR